MKQGAFFIYTNAGVIKKSGYIYDSGRNVYGIDNRGTQGRTSWHVTDITTGLECVNGARTRKEAAERITPRMEDFIIEKHTANAYDKEAQAIAEAYAKEPETIKERKPRKDEYIIEYYKTETNVTRARFSPKAHPHFIEIEAPAGDVDAIKAEILKSHPRAKFEEAGKPDPRAEEYNKGDHKHTAEQMRELYKQFVKEYSFLYNADCNGQEVAGTREAVAYFDENIKALADILNDFGAYRGDLITSDREAAALVFALEWLEMLPEEGSYGETMQNLSKSDREEWRILLERLEQTKTEQAKEQTADTPELGAEVWSKPHRARVKVDGIEDGGQLVRVIYRGKLYLVSAADLYTDETETTRTTIPDAIRTHAAGDHHEDAAGNTPTETDAHEQERPPAADHPTDTRTEPAAPIIESRHAADGRRTTAGRPTSRPRLKKALSNSCGLCYYKIEYPHAARIAPDGIQAEPPNADRVRGTRSHASGITLEDYHRTRGAPKNGTNGRDKGKQNAPAPDRRKARTPPALEPSHPLRIENRNFTGLIHRETGAEAFLKSGLISEVDF